MSITTILLIIGGVLLAAWFFTSLFNADLTTTVNTTP